MSPDTLRLLIIVSGFIMAAILILLKPLGGLMDYAIAATVLISDVIAATVVHSILTKRERK